jgi:steroid 5-alpha reductase family enzyme
MLVVVLVVGALVIAAALMALLWVRQWFTNIAAIVDVGWPLSVALIALWAYAMGDGAPERRTLALAMGGIWGLRLSSYLFATRIWDMKEESDGRYAQLRQDWKTHLQLKFFVFFEFQAGLAAIFGLPFLLMALNPAPGLSPLEWIGAAVWSIGVVGETTADLQLNAFKRDPANRGKICRVGLWNVSRHPNYFFEWLVWVGACFAALASPAGWIAIVCPALMLFFLFKVTGIPTVEAQALRSRGDAYREYQRTTSAFVPWFRKS